MNEQLHKSIEQLHKSIEHPEAFREQLKAFIEQLKKMLKEYNFYDKEKLEAVEKDLNNAFTKVFINQNTIDIHDPKFFNYVKTHILETKGVPTDPKKPTEDFPNLLEPALIDTIKLLPNGMKSDKVAEFIGEPVYKILDNMECGKYYKICNVTRDKHENVNGGHAMIIYKKDENSFTFANPNQSEIQTLNKEELLYQVFYQMMPPVSVLMDNDQFLRRHYPEIIKQENKISDNISTHIVNEISTKSQVSSERVRDKSIDKHQNTGNKIKEIITKGPGKDNTKRGSCCAMF